MQLLRGVIDFFLKKISRKILSVIPLGRKSVKSYLCLSANSICRNYS